MNKKALILYISKHSGHFHAASAIEKGLQETVSGIETEKINALTYTNPILSRIINTAYLGIIKKRPEIWGRIYDNPDFMRKTAGIRKMLHTFNLSKMRKLLDSYQPDIVFCTQAFPCGMVADYKRMTGSKVQLVGVLTDHAAHSYWLFDEVDWYITPSEETSDVLKGKGVPAGKVKAFGIPVDPKFRVKHDTSRVLEKFGFSSDAPTILIMGGSQGLGAMEDVVRAFLKDESHGYQLIIVTGSNQTLYKRLQDISGKHTGICKIKVLSFADNIDELMEEADLIVTKAGGMTTAEALVKNLPIILIDQIPGQERANADYLVKKGAAIEVDDCGQIYQKVNELFDTKGRLDSMRKSSRSLSKPDSALDIAKFIYKV